MGIPTAPTAKKPVSCYVVVLFGSLKASGMHIVCVESFIEKNLIAPLPVL